MTIYRTLEDFICNICGYVSKNACEFNIDTYTGKLECRENHQDMKSEEPWDIKLN